MAMGDMGHIQIDEFTCRILSYCCIKGKFGVLPAVVPVIPSCLASVNINSDAAIDLCST